MLTFQSLVKTGSFAPSPSRKHRRKIGSNFSSFGSENGGVDKNCDCESYRSYAMACPCSARHAARTGKRATERILTKSRFFDRLFFTADQGKNAAGSTGGGEYSALGNQNQNSHPLIISSENATPNQSQNSNQRHRHRHHYDRSKEGSNIQMPNKVAELDPRQVEVRGLLGKGGFCEVHSAMLVLPSDNDVSDDSESQSSETEEGLTCRVAEANKSSFLQNTATHPVLNSIQELKNSLIVGGERKEKSIHDTEMKMSITLSHSHEQELNSRATTPTTVTTATSSTSASTTTQSHSSANQQDAQEQTITLKRQQKVQAREDIQTLLKTNSEYCIKFLKPSILVDPKKFARGTADLAIEAHFLAALQHAHILKLRAVTQGFKLFEPRHPLFLSNLTHHAGREGCLFVVLDKLDSTLDQRITGRWSMGQKKYEKLLYRSTHDLTGQKRRALKIEPIRAALQLAEALQYLHSHNIVYRDLKPDNVGFDHEDNVKLFDFGLVKELKAYRREKDGTYLLSGNTGSRRYMAPEVAKHQRYNLSVDVYSFGILLWEMCTLEKPFDGFTENTHTARVINGGFRPELYKVKQNWPKEVRVLLKSCWQDDLHSRPPFTEVVDTLKDIYKKLNKGKGYASIPYSDDP